MRRTSLFIRRVIRGAESEPPPRAAPNAPAPKPIAVPPPGLLANLVAAWMRLDPRPRLAPTICPLVAVSSGLILWIVLAEPGELFAPGAPNPNKFVKGEMSWKKPPTSRPKPPIVCPKPLRKEASRTGEAD